MFPDYYNNKKGFKKNTRLSKVFQKEMQRVNIITGILIFNILKFNIIIEIPQKSP